MKSKQANEVVAFIRKDLKKKLGKDFGELPFNIFREEDLHAACYFHLRRFLEGHGHWRILNEPFLRSLKSKGRSAAPDILLCRNDKPTILIELKFRKHKSGIHSKDFEVLREAVKHKEWAKKAFYIEAVVDPFTEVKDKPALYQTQLITLTVPLSNQAGYRDAYKTFKRPDRRRMGVAIDTGQNPKKMHRGAVKLFSE